VCVAQMSTLFSCCVHGKVVTGSRSRDNIVRGSVGQSFPEAETLLTFGRAMEAADLPRKFTNICVFLQK